MHPGAFQGAKLLPQFFAVLKHQIDLPGVRQLPYLAQSVHNQE